MNASKLTAVDLAAAVRHALDVPLPHNDIDYRKYYNLLQSREAWIRGVLASVAEGDSAALTSTIKTLAAVDESYPVNYLPYVPAEATP